MLEVPSRLTVPLLRSAELALTVDPDSTFRVAPDGGSYQGGTVKVIDLDSINGAEIIVNNIDSKYVYRGDDGDVLFSDASKEILKGNTSWSSIAFGDAVTEAGTDFYKGVNAFDNGTALWAQFEENVTTEVEIGAGDFTDGNVTSASHRFIGGEKHSA